MRFVFLSFTLGGIFGCSTATSSAVTAPVQPPLSSSRESKETPSTASERSAVASAPSAVASAGPEPTAAERCELPPADQKIAVAFADPPVSAGTGQHGGPEWTFTQRGLPALSPDGAVVIVGQVEETLGGVPNLEIAELRVADDVISPTMPILSVKEFTAALHPDNSAADGPAFAELGVRVCERVKHTNELLRTGHYAALTSCSLTEDPFTAQPPCSFRAQHLTCADVSVAYERQRLSFKGAGLSRSIARPRWAPKPLVTESFGTVPVRECFAQAFFAPDARLFIGELYNACQQGGDWCTVPSVWHAVKP